MCLPVCLSFVHSADTDQQRQEVGAAAGALLGAWLGAFVIPLDWDRHWQVRDARLGPPLAGTYG